MSEGFRGLGRRLARRSRLALVGLSALTLTLATSFRPVAAGLAQTAPAHLTIPLLANATKPADLDFQAGECEIAPAGTAMTCRFEQVFLTASPLRVDTCLVTTSRYEQVFQKTSGSRWTSRGAPEGACGIVEITTLTDDGGVRWTLESKKIVTNTTEPACRKVDATSEILSWQNLRRALPCTFVQPGALTP
jgi:hypothetical protein